MNFRSILRNWIQQTIQDAKSLVLLGCFMAVASFILWMLPQLFYQGMALPMALLSLILLFYGGFTIKNRPQLEQQLLAAYQKASRETLKREKQRMLAEKNNHTKIQLTWGLVLLAGVASRLVLAAPYSKGIATGFALMGLFLLLTDLWALRRMNQYKVSIQTL